MNINELTIEQCFDIAKIVSDNLIKSVSEINQITRGDKNNRIEIFWHKSTHKIDIIGIEEISFLIKSKKNNTWQLLPVYNYLDFIKYLLNISAISL